MNSTAVVRKKTCLVTLAGEFDRSNVDALRAEIEACMTSASSVLFDFGAVTFINGAVMSLLHDIVEELGSDGWLGVARPVAWILKQLGAAGLSELPNFRVFATLEEALEVVDRG